MVVPVTGRTSPSRTNRNRVCTRIAVACCASGLGLGTGAAHPLYGMLTAVMLLLPATVLVVLAVCLPDERSDRLYRWGRLLLGREEPPSPAGVHLQRRVTGCACPIPQRSRQSRRLPRNSVQLKQLPPSPKRVR